MKKTIILIFILMMTLSMSVFADETVTVGSELLEDGSVLHYSITETELNSDIMNHSESMSGLQFSSMSDSWTEKSKSVSAYFYLVSSGETVARFGLDATFRYNGTYVSVTGGNSWGSSEKPGYSIQHKYTITQDVDKYGRVDGDYWLMKDGNKINETGRNIICDVNGNIELN